MAEMATQRRPQDRVREFMREQGRSYQWLASKLGADPATVGRKIAGRVRWAQWEAERVRDLLGCPFDLLFPDPRRIAPESTQPYGRRSTDVAPVEEE